MNRSIIIFTVFVAIIIVAAGAMVLLRPSAPAPSGQDGIPTVTYPPDSPGSSNNLSKAAVQSAYRNELAKHESDNTKLGETMIFGSYALQVYAGDIMGGEALLKYDAGKGIWVLVDGGGGAWTVESLVQQGVPQNTATALLAGLPR